MKTAPFSVAVLLVASVGISALTVGCAQQQEVSVPTLHTAEEYDAAVAKIQNDASKSPDEKVKEIDAIQQHYPNLRPPKKSKHPKDE